MHSERRETARLIIDEIDNRIEQDWLNLADLKSWIVGKFPQEPDEYERSMDECQSQLTASCKSAAAEDWLFWTNQAPSVDDRAELQPSSDCWYCDAQLPTDFDRNSETCPKCESWQDDDDIDDSDEGIIEKYQDDQHDNILDITYLSGHDGELQDVIICCATGGPHIELDTRDRTIHGYWSSCTNPKASVDSATCDKVVEYYSELFQSLVQR